jgi:AmmeMemoRadiSam system protein B
VYHDLSMARRLAPLRRSLDAMPSPVRDRPGLLLRDPFRYAEDVVIVPSPLVPFLRFFDGGHDEGDLAAALYRATGQLGAGEYARGLADSLGRGGFLEDDELERRRSERERAFAGAVLREPSHQGAAYPEDADALRATLARYLAGAGADEGPAPARVLAVAAPHVSPEGGWRSYASAYRALPQGAGERTVVVLGTSHYGAPERFGLTRKRYRTPLGDTAVDLAVVDSLAAAAGEGAVVEDYCHAVEHSIEFQVVFLQHLLGAAVRVVPVLCGPLVKATLGGERPEDDPHVARFLDALADLAAREGHRLLWVLGVDMAHVGRRYGDEEPARAGEGAMRAVEERDRRRIAALVSGDASAFWEQVREGGDELRWCGASALYAFLRAVGPGPGALLRYEQWNIDPESVVSFGALAFGEAAASAEEGGS